MIKAVFFDLDGTLLDRDASVKRFISGQYDRLTDYLSHIPKNDYIARFIELDCHGHVWKDKVYQALVTEFVIEGISWQALLKDYEMRFQFYCVPFQFLGRAIYQISNIKGNFTLRSQQRTTEYFDKYLFEPLKAIAYFAVNSGNTDYSRGS
jgi:putative hydrolase of the HAD superfamily